ncbi:MAG: YdeI/OmpD-associated family protein [Pyrinomonadaceae bacterium]
MAGKQTFETVLTKHENMEATGITIPFDVEAVFGAKRVQVKAVINGAEYRGSIVRSGGRYCMGVPKAFREAARIGAGDHIVVTIEKDIEPRTVAPPKDLADALANDPIASAGWDKLSYTHQKEHVQAIEDAKKPETRARRIQKAVEMIAAAKSNKC